VSTFGARLGDIRTIDLACRLPSRLPWPLAYRCFRRLARREGLFPDAVAGAAIAPQTLPIADVAAFRRDVRTTMLLDTADLYLSRRHRLDWWPESVAVEGEWPRHGAFLAITFHYGTGIWLCRSLRRAGHRARFLSGRFDAADFTGRPRVYRYGIERLAEVERIGGAPPIFRPGARVDILRTLDAGDCVIGLIDVPPRLAPRDQRPATLLGQRASLPDGLVRLAREAGVPVVPCWVEVDFARGTRRVVIEPPLRVTQDAGVLDHFAAVLDRIVRAQPAAWQFWREWPAWIADARGLHAGRAFSNEQGAGTLDHSDATTGSGT